MKEYPCCDFRHGVTQEPQLDTSSSTNWVKSDLCSQCSALDLPSYLSGYRLVRAPFKSLTVRKQATCPMCVYLLATVANDINAACDADVTLNVDCYISPHYPRQSFPRISVRTFDGLSTPGRLIIPFNGALSDEQAPLTVRLLRNPIDFGLLESWMSFCQKHHHRQCATPQLERRNRCFKIRVIHCETREIIDADDSCVYVALSYVWGAYKPPTTVPYGSDIGKPIHLPAELPRTIEDTITVVRQLHFKYLWVDQFCIDQGDARELHRQLDLMDLIYNFAALTIVAAAGDSASFGLPGVSRPRNLQPTISVDGQLWVSALEDPRQCVARSTWSSRAWTFQEGLFARQRLLFTTDQVAFECNGANFFFESLSQDAHRFRSQGTTSTLLQHTDWDSSKIYRHHVTEYAKRKLSFQSDALKGLQGIFTHLFSTRNFKQWWGLPLRSRPGMAFATWMLWQTDQKDLPQRREGFPSWSWCGWIAPVSWSETVMSVPLGKRKGTILGGREQPEVWTGCEVQFQFMDGTIYDCKEVEEIAANTEFSAGSRCSPNLLISAEIIEVQFRIISTTGCSPTASKPGGSLESYAIAAAKTKVTFDKRTAVIIWPISTILPIIKGSSLHQSFLESKFKVVVIHERFGLVIHKVGGVYERIGMINLQGDLGEEDFRALQRHAWRYGVVDERKGRPQLLKLSDYFPSKRETIVLA